MPSHDPQPTPATDAASILPSAPSSPEEGLVHAETPDFFIRTARSYDLASLAEVLASSFHSQTGTWGWLYPVLRVGIYEDLRTRLQNRKPHYACLVAALRQPSAMVQAANLGQSGGQGLEVGLGDRPIGTVEISLRQNLLNPFRSSRYLYLSNLAVAADCRRRGVAQHLLQTCERIALDWGFRELHLHVLENNHRARQLYWKAGYRLQAVETNPIGLLLKRPRQLLLVKALNG